MKREHQRRSVRLACVCLCFFWLPLRAQLIELPNIELISEKDGLPFNSTNAIVQDKQGFIWIGSSDGLARYDGYTFLTFQYDPANKNSLPNNTIMALAVDKKGFIWASHLGGYISKIDPIKHTIWYTKIPGAEESVFRKIFCDSKGRVWCYMDFMGIFLYDGSKFNYVASLTDLPSNGPAEGKWYNRVTDIVEDNDGKFWITSANGLYSFSLENKVFKKESSLSNDERVPVSLHKILLDDDNGCWLATYGNGLIYYNRTNGTYTKYLFQPTSSGTTNIINGMARKSETEIWVATNGKGLGLFNTLTKKYTFYYEEDAIDSGPLSADMLVDRDGIVWVLSDKGIFKWNVSVNNFLFKKLKVSRSDNLAYYGVSDVLEDSITGRTIIGTQYTEGLYIITANGTVIKQAIEKYPNAEEYMLVTDLMRDRDGRIWVITRDYVYELTTDNRLIKMNGINSLLKPNQIPYFSRLLQSTNGDLWLGSRNGVFHKPVNGSWERLSAETPHTLANNRVLRLAEDAHHRIWMAHAVEGITVYNPSDKTFRNYKHLPNDSSSLVSNIFTDMASTSNGEIYIATQEGISHYNPQQDVFDNFNLASGLPSQVIASINTDEDNNVWAMTNKGLVRMDVRTNRISLYGFKDGLQGIYSSFLMRRGGYDKMYLCTFQGFYTFSPRQVAISGNKPVPVIITAVKNLTTLKNQFNATHTTVVDYDNNSISIEFAALNYLSPLNNRYRFKMEGLSRGWTETDKNVVTFSGLPSGEYTFMVYLAGGDAIGQCARLQIIVTTPFWKQIWFRVLVIALIVAISFWAYRARLRAVRQEEKLKTDFNKKLAEVELKALKAQMSPHFIFNSLNSINRYIIKSEPEKASLYLTKFSKLIRLILDNSNSKIISLDQELTALKLYIELEALRFNEKFSYTLTVNEDLNPHSIGVPPMIIQPFIENAIWHGLLHKDTPGKLSITIERYGHGLQCIIEDDGVGRKRAAELKSKSVNKEKSYGMKITSDRLNMLNGESKVSSVEIIDLTDAHGNACGTKVIVKIMSAELEPEF